MVVTTWAIWTTRRKAIHEAIFQSSHATHSFINNFISELDILKGPTNARGPRGAASNIHAGGRTGWRAPDVGVAKVHVDGGLSRNGRQGAAASICRDRTGIYLGSSAMVFDGITDPATLEALACRRLYH